MNSLSIWSQTVDEILTPFEHSGKKKTATYQEGIKFYEELSNRFPAIQIKKMGLTDSRFPLHLVSWHGVNSRTTEQENISVLIINAIHPGVVGTGLGEGGLISRMLRFARPLLKSPEDGAKGLVHLATEPSIQGIRGRYFVGTSDTEPSPRGRDDQIGEQLYTWLDTQLGPLPPLTVTPEGSH